MLDHECWCASQHTVVPEGAGDHRISSHNAMCAQCDAGQNYSAISQKAAITDGYRSFALQRLMQNGIAVRVHSVSAVCDVYVVTQHTRGTDRNAVNGGEIKLAPNIDAITDAHYWYSTPACPDTGVGECLVLATQAESVGLVNLKRPEGIRMGPHGDTGRVVEQILQPQPEPGAKKLLDLGSEHAQV